MAASSTPKRITTWLEQAGDDWFVKVKLDEYEVFEESAFGELEALRLADEFIATLLHDLAGDATERAAHVADEIATGESRTPAEKAVARMLAKRIREGRP